MTLINYLPNTLYDLPFIYTCEAAEHCIYKLQYLMPIDNYNINLNTIFMILNIRVIINTNMYAFQSSIECIDDLFVNTIRIIGKNVGNNVFMCMPINFYSLKFLQFFST